jgi:hypothetical protein
MEKSENSQDEMKLKVVKEEIEKFEKLIKGHKKLLAAIGNL